MTPPADLDPEALKPTSPLQDLATSLLLVERARRGESGAFGEFFEHFRARLLRIVRIEIGRELGCWIDPEDVLAETFLIAMRKIADFEPRSRASILAWLAAIAKNKLKEEHRRSGRLRAQALDSVGSSINRLEPMDREARGPSTQASQFELEEILDATLVELKPEHYQVILLRHYYDADWEEIGLQLQCSPHASEQLYQRAKQNLKRALGRRFGSSREGL